MSNFNPQVPCNNYNPLPQCSTTPPIPPPIGDFCDIAVLSYQNEFPEVDLQSGNFSSPRSGLLQLNATVLQQATIGTQPNDATTFVEIERREFSMNSKQQTSLTLNKCVHGFPVHLSYCYLHFVRYSDIVITTVCGANTGSPDPICTIPGNSSDYIRTWFRLPPVGDSSDATIIKQETLAAADHGTVWGRMSYADQPRAQPILWNNRILTAESGWVEAYDPTTCDLLWRTDPPAGESWGYPTWCPDWYTGELLLCQGVYVAPFFYARLYVIDPTTGAVQNTNYPQVQVYNSNELNNQVKGGFLYDKHFFLPRPSSGSATALMEKFTDYDSGEIVGPAECRIDTHVATYSDPWGHFFVPGQDKFWVARTNVGFPPGNPVSVITQLQITP